MLIIINYQWQGFLYFNYLMVSSTTTGLPPWHFQLQCDTCSVVCFSRCQVFAPVIFGWRNNQKNLQVVSISKTWKTCGRKESDGERQLESAVFFKQTENPLTILWQLKEISHLNQTPLQILAVSSICLG